LLDLLRSFQIGLLNSLTRSECSHFSSRFCGAVLILHLELPTIRFPIGQGIRVPPSPNLFAPHRMETPHPNPRPFVLAAYQPTHPKRDKHSLFPLADSGTHVSPTILPSTPFRTAEPDPRTVVLTLLPRGSKVHFPFFPESRRECGYPLRFLFSVTFLRRALCVASSTVDEFFFLFLLL